MFNGDALKDNHGAFQLIHRQSFDEILAGGKNLNNFYGFKSVDPDTGYVRSSSNTAFKITSLNLQFNEET